MLAAGIPLFDGCKFVLRFTARDVQHSQGGIKAETAPLTPKGFPRLPRRGDALDASASSAQRHEGDPSPQFAVTGGAILLAL